MELPVMQSNKKYALILLGPTGVGKSGCAELLAESMPAEIINMDIGSFYTRLKIGTAKPDWKKSPIVHHMFDVIDKPESLSVTQYRTMVSKILNDVWQRGNVPILVGGSGFYLKSLFFPPKINPSCPEGSKKIQNDDVSWEKLNSIDPARAKHIHPNDTYRITRALELWASTGKKPSELVPAYNPLITDYDLVYLTRDRNELYTIINERTTQMMQQGLPNEAYQLYKDPEWKNFLSHKKIIGYDDFFPYFAQHGNNNKPIWLKQVADKIGCRTRAYARRQEIFWKMLKKMLRDAGDNNDKEMNLSSIERNYCVEQMKEMVCKKQVA